MDRQQALELLPEAHAVALRLVDDSADMAVIASQLDIERDAVPLLLRVAEDKLATLLGRFPPAESQPSPSQPSEVRHSP